jgi:signal transduction histidine kinase
MIEFLKNEKTRDDNTLLEKRNGVLQSDYIKIFRATETHQPIAAVVIQRPAGEISQTIFMNRIWIIVAGLIAGAGAIIAFYMITQRVILRPIRQLRAIANNVAEGNLDVRSAIKTGDEYEKLADAFNHMLDGLQAAQQKLRQANKQLDEKIAELSERNIELFKANKLKGEFLANISHEFKTPLNAILGFAEILREKPEALKKDKAKRYAENIITGGKNLLNMINDLLDLAKTEAGRMKLHVEKTSLSGLCDVVVGSFAAGRKDGTDCGNRYRLRYCRSG